MSLNYLVCHSILATAVAAYWDDGYNLVTLGLEKYFLDIDTVVTKCVKDQDQNLDLTFCMLLQAFVANKVTGSFTWH